MGKRGSDYIRARHTLDAINILQIQRPPAPLAKPLVGLAGLLRHDEGRVLCKALKLLLHTLFQSFTAANQANQHKDAPKHAKGGEQAAGAVAGDGNQNLLAGVSIE